VFGFSVSSLADAYVADGYDDEANEDACYCCSLGRAPGTSAMVLTFTYLSRAFLTDAPAVTLSLSLPLFPL